MGKMFGTDGVRGIANRDLTCELAMNIGRAAAYVLLEKNTEKPKVLIGKDTRVSSGMLEMALAAGLCSVGADVVLAGYIPTPAVAYLVKQNECDAGIMISASHNPCEYNGIKIFDRSGYKLPDALEDEIEEMISGGMQKPEYPIGKDVGSVFERPDFLDEYIDHVVRCVKADLTGMKIVIDCANGCASYTAEKLFKKLGADVVMIHNHPNGININAACGSTHMEDLIDYVNGHHVDLGLAFDGDSDRCLAVDQNGKLIDGDRMIAVFAKYLKDHGELANNTAVVTVMTNLGFKIFAQENDITVDETAVGDRYVLESMLKNGYVIGGEQSGHIIFKNYATTGDGQLSGAMLAKILCEKHQDAAAVAAVMEVLPQTMINVPADAALKERLKTDEQIRLAIDDVTRQLGSAGRILVRASGTEPLIRVMLEGKNIKQIKQLAKKVADVISSKGEG